MVVNPEAVPRPAAEQHHVVRWRTDAVVAFGITQPPFRLELQQIREDRLVHVDMVGVHAHRRVGRYCPAAVLQSTQAIGSRESVNGSEA